MRRGVAVRLALFIVATLAVVSVSNAHICAQSAALVE